MRMMMVMNQEKHIERPFTGTLFSVEVATWSDEQGRDIRREMVRHPGAVMIVPQLDDGRLVLIRNYRIAPDQRLWEFPAGKLEPGEAPLATAQRELAEETGYQALQWHGLGTFYTSPGFADELMHVFLARGLTAGSTALEPGEDIEVMLMRRDEIDQLLSQGEVQDAKTLAGLLFLQRFESMESSP
jgi:ADP-ribose pyrophosphatase